MGLILDSSVLITAERQGQNARQMLAAIGRTAGNTDIAISVVTLIELAHGATRADTAQRKEKRREFIHELFTALPIHLVTVMVALRVGQIDGENQARRCRRCVANRIYASILARENAPRGSLHQPRCVTFSI
jgi:predicted nucleic acid-binding protein